MFQTPRSDFKSFSPLALGLLSMMSMRPRPAFAQKLGLSSSFGDVTLQNVRVGTPYPLRQLKGHGYSVTNLSDVAVDLVIEPVPPIKGSLRPYYEPLPDASWVKIAPAKFHLEPGATASGEVTLLVPNDAGWQDRNYQCALYTHTLQGSFLNVGIYDKLFFSTGAGPDTARGQGAHLQWLPSELKINIRPDGAIAPAAGPAALELLNASDSTATVHFETVASDPSVKTPKGYTLAADTGSLHFETPSADFAGGQTQAASFLLKAPEPGVRSEAFRVRAYTESPALETYGWVLVKVGKKANVKTERQQK